MKSFIVIAAHLILFATGCANRKLVASAALPVYGTDPLMHTEFRGSDHRFHYFHVQHDKSGGEVVVARHNAVIKPESFARDSGRSAFVKQASHGEIELIVLGR